MNNTEQLAAGQNLAKKVLELKRFCDNATPEEILKCEEIKDLAKMAGFLTADCSEYCPNDDIGFMDGGC